MKVLVVGPSSTKSKGGMATVVKEIEEDDNLCKDYHIDSYASYVDGSRMKVMFYSFFAFIRFYFTKRGYDIYHIHMASWGSTFRKSYYVKLVKKWGKKVIIHIHGAQFLVFYNQISDKKKEAVVSILKSADRVVALSDDWKQKFDDTFSLKNCISIENGINMEKLSSAVQPIDKYRKSFLTLGRLGKRKGTYDLISAIEIVRKTIPDIKCYLAGDGEVEQAKKLVSQKHLEKNIEVIGWADFNQKLKLLRNVSTVVLPSYNEGLPMSILEGMACGKAIISTIVGAIPEVVGRENGILIKAGDVNALADAMITCCLDIDYMNQVSRANRKKIRQGYSMQMMHKKLAACYDKVYEGSFDNGG